MKKTSCKNAQYRRLDSIDLVSVARSGLGIDIVERNVGAFDSAKKFFLTEVKIAVYLQKQPLKKQNSAEYPL